MWLLDERSDDAVWITHVHIISRYLTKMCIETCILDVRDSFIISDRK